MATINVLLNESRADRNGLYPILIKVRNGKEKKEIAVGYRIDKKYWLESEQRVSKKHPDAALINSAIENKRSEIARAIHDAELQDRQVRVKSLGNKRPQSLFTNYLKYRADDYKARGKNVMQRKVITFYRELLECFAEGTYFDDIDMDWMRRLDAWLIEKGNVANTRARKFKFFRGFFQNAIDEGEAEGPNPFKLYKINQEPVNKPKLTLKQVQAIEQLKLKGARDVARDMWLFSFYCKGSRFENCATIKLSDINNGRIYWQANKGKKWISVAMHDKLQAIVNKYKKNGTPYLFPVLKEEYDDVWKLKEAVESANVVVNRNLKVIGALEEVKEPGLTFHIARHTFAFILKKNTNSIHVIKDALGHSDTRTTEIYLASLDDEAIDPDVAKVYRY